MATPTYEEVQNANNSIQEIVHISKHKAVNQKLLDYAEGRVKDEDYGSSWSTMKVAASARKVYAKIESLVTAFANSIKQGNNTLTTPLSLTGGHIKLNNCFLIASDGTMYIKEQGDVGNFRKFIVQPDGFIPQQLEDTGYNNIDDLINSL